MFLIALISLVAFITAALFFYNFIYLFRLKTEPEEVIYYRKPSPTVKILRPFLLALSKYNEKIIPPTWSENISRQLIRSGNPNGLDPVLFLGLKEVGALLGLILGILLALKSSAVILAIPLFAIGGFFLPNLWLKEQVNRRMQAIIRALPFNLDLLTLCVEAGLDFLGALQQVVDKGRPGPLKDELAQLVHEIRMGKSRSEALRDMAERIGLVEITSFTAALIQADILGTSIAPVLRLQSDQRRTERFQKAEKLAMEAPVKMLFPLIAFIFPTVFIVIFFPIIMKLIGSL